MLNLVSILWPAIIVFVSTDLDDLVVVSAFFAEPGVRWRTIVLGQFIGIGTLVFASVLAALAALSLPRGFIAYLGAVPLVFGLYRLRHVRRHDSLNIKSTGPQPGSQVTSSLLTVTTITMANGSDNLSVYVPFFARAPAYIPIYVATFACLTALWCLAGYLLINHTPWSRGISRLSRVILPLIMIMIGLSLLRDAYPLKHLTRHLHNALIRSQ